jgi:type I restriction enzyme M protein
MPRDGGAQANDLCRRADLGNEATVEQFFVNRLLVALGYADRQIKPKRSIDELRVNRGRRRVRYRPDYALQVGRTIRWIVDAKATGESLDEFVGQCAGYCLLLNRRHKNNPVEYFLLTNGLVSRLYRWDQEEPILELAFRDFTSGNALYRKLHQLISPSAFTARATTADEELFTLAREPLDVVNAAFAWCHQFIYRKDNLSQAAAFSEFVKIVFLKLLSDRDIHRDHPELAGQASASVPADTVRFSVRWIEEREDGHPSPLDALRFQALLKDLETEIHAGTRKRVFEADEHIDLTPETIKGVVRRLEHIDLFGIDADLNGRLFETFLNTTMRGKDLGQYFTPRSVVKLGVKLAQLKVDPDKPDTVIDACCGTGGFLIDVLADMSRTIDANASLSEQERSKLKRRVATDCLVGIDVARDPPLARIARMNMYLHGDGGSSIYQADALDKQLRESPNAKPELRREIKELRERLEHKQFKVALTNPPFAKEYERQEPREREILASYDLAFTADGGARKAKPRLRSSVMFLERYHNLLESGGRLVTVVDDSILGSDSYAATRDFIRERFLIRAVVSLAGDAFQRSNARVKTSLIVLEKRESAAEEQPPAFMYYTTAVGVDDSQRQRALPVDRVNRELAAAEIDRVAAMYEAFRRGEPKAKRWTVPPERLQGRIDVKSCLPKPARMVSTWRKGGAEVVRLTDLVDVVLPGGAGEDLADDPDLIITAESDELVTHLRVRYDGFPEAGEEIVACSSKYAYLYRVHEHDIVISHINAIHGAICVVPPELDGLVVTTEYSVCRAKPGKDPRIVWLLLRSGQVRSDLLLLSTGIGRSRVKWDAASAVQMPLPPKPLAGKVKRSLTRAEALEREAKQLRERAARELGADLRLESAEASKIIAAFKPPR